MNRLEEDNYRAAYPSPRPALPRKHKELEPLPAALATAPSYDARNPTGKPSGGNIELTSTVTLEGTLERVSYANEENGYTIARLHVVGKRKPQVIVGYLPGIIPGEALRLEGKWLLHPQYGRQFTVERYQVAPPATLSTIKKYLGGGLLRGVGPGIAEQIVNHFGLQTLEVLAREPARLREVPHLGPRRAAAIVAAWQEQRTIKELMQFLQTQQMNVSLALRIYRHYGEQSLDVLRNHPYRLITSVYGADFATVDRMATGLGLTRSSDERIAAGLIHLLASHSEGGHAFMPLRDLLEAGEGLLNIGPNRLASVLEEQMEGEAVKLDRVAEQQVVYPLYLYHAEVGVAALLHRVMQAKDDRLARFRLFNWEKAHDYLRMRTTLDLSEQQQDAVKLALTSPLMVLTGGPGTGKTTTLRAIIELLQTKGNSVILAAPTGRAARRLTEATGAPASTIHRLLELKPGGGMEFSGSSPLDADVIIIDEASMMDLPLTYALLKAVPPGSHLVLVGDADQLPPVGPGDVLRDVIESGAVPIVRLEQVFRQAEASAIIANAHLINAGEMPVIANANPDSDFFFVNAPLQDSPDLIAELVSTRIPRKFRFQPLDDIQVLSPMHAGPVGVAALNVRLQEVLNPPAAGKAEHRYGDRIFREGDKVMQATNDYDKKVFNGDIGRIVQIDPLEQSVRVLFDTELSASYAFGELDELAHAYAISVHKAQGSEYPVVVLPVTLAHQRMLARNLLYTAISRARKLVVLVGTRDAIALAVRNDRSADRYSALRQRLQNP